MKTCRVCGEEKGIDQFNRDRNAADGRDGRCNSCKNDQNKSRKNPRRDAGSAVCASCQTVRPVSEFGTNSRYPDGLHPRCKECQADQARFHRYGVDRKQYDEMLAAQGGRCAICGRTDTSYRKSFSVDHDHQCCPDTQRSCGECIRGLLCQLCNVILGYAKDNPNTLRRAAEYLESYDR